MLDTVFVHRRAVPNVGDLSCSPGLYFDLGHHAFCDFGAPVPACHRMVLGGGQVFQDCVHTAILSAQQTRQTVVWGVGIDPKDRRSLEFDLLDGTCSLISTRNWGINGVDYVPCPSAMSPLFDRPPAPTRDVVLFFHARKSKDLQRDDAIPCRDNHTGDMAQAIRFLASAETIVTNSYHGTYWGLCLGRRVLCLPFSQKFLQFPDNPVQADPKDWVRHIHKAEARPDLLEMARSRNRQFYEKLRNLG